MIILNRNLSGLRFTLACEGLQLASLAKEQGYIWAMDWLLSLRLPQMRKFATHACELPLEAIQSVRPRSQADL